MGKYDKLVFEFPAEYNEVVALGDDPGFILSPQAYFRGGTQIPGANFNCGFQVFVKPFFLDRIPHFAQSRRISGFFRRYFSEPV
jgi:hypothetical protein